MELFGKYEIGSGEDTWVQEFFIYETVSEKVSSVHSFSFVDDGHIVLGHHSSDEHYHSGKGHYGNLGGGTEAGETMEQTLRREIKEEGNAELIRWAPVLLVRHIKKGGPWDKTWQVWGWSDVELLPGDTFVDVGGDVDGREVVPIEQVAAKLKWGEEKIRVTLEVMLAARAKNR